MCTSEDAYTTPVVNPVSLAGAMASRAIARPIRFARDPPLVTVPPNPVQPTASASQETTVRSIIAVAGPDRQAVPFWLITDANRSPKAAHRLSRAHHVAEEASVPGPAVLGHGNEVIECRGSQTPLGYRPREQLAGLRTG